MAKCKKCGKSLFLKKKIQLSDAEVCESCSTELGLDQCAYPPAFKYEDIKDGYQTYLERQRKAAAARKEYFFLVHDLDGEFIEKYRKENTDKEDLWDGMTFKDIRDNCYEGDKIYKYPEMKVYPDFKESTLDGNPALEVYLDDHMVGYVPKTKVSKAKKLLEDENVTCTAELYGGDYQYLKGNYVEEWFDKVNIKVTFNWTEETAENQ